MSLYRANDRLPQDERFLRIYDYAELALFRERDALKLSGLVYDFTLSDELKRQSIEYARNALRKGYGVRDNLTRSSIWLHPKFDTKGEMINPKYQEQMRQYEVPEAMRLALTLSIAGGHKATGIIEPETYLRVNSIFPKSHHTHEEGNHGVSMSFNEAGSEIETPGGGSFVFQAGQLAVFEDKVRHRAAQIDPEILVNSPRVILC